MDRHTDIRFNDSIVGILDPNRAFSLMLSQSLRTPEKDGFLLDVVLYIPSISTKGIIIINVGIITLQPFYTLSANCFSTNGFATIYFDDRGVGKFWELWLFTLDWLEAGLSKNKKV